MKVKIGNYVPWFGGYQLAELIVFWNKDLAHLFGRWLSDTWVHTFLSWIHSKRKRTIKIHINSFDCWNADFTLALIIAPVLKQLKEQTHGSPVVDDEDVPESYHTGKSEFGSPNNIHERWAYVLDEMIFAFDAIIKDSDEMNFDVEHNKRIANGLRLFGKYFRGLWD